MVRHRARRSRATSDAGDAGGRRDVGVLRRATPPGTGIDLAHRVRQRGGRARARGRATARRLAEATMLLAGAQHRQRATSTRADRALRRSRTRCSPTRPTTGAGRSAPTPQGRAACAPRRPRRRRPAHDRVGARTSGRRRRVGEGAGERRHRACWPRRGATSRPRSRGSKGARAGRGRPRPRWRGGALHRPARQLRADRAATSSGADALHTEALALGEAVGVPARPRASPTTAGRWSAGRRASSTRPREWAERGARRCATEPRDVMGEALALASLGFVAERQGDLERARACTTTRASTLAREMNEPVVPRARARRSRRRRGRGGRRRPRRRRCSDARTRCAPRRAARRPGPASDVERITAAAIARSVRRRRLRRARSTHGAAAPTPDAARRRPATRSSTSAQCRVTANRTSASSGTRRGAPRRAPPARSSAPSSTSATIATCWRSRRVTRARCARRRRPRSWSPGRRRPLGPTRQRGVAERERRVGVDGRGRRPRPPPSGRPASSSVDAGPVGRGRRGRRSRAGGRGPCVASCRSPLTAR